MATKIKVITIISAVLTVLSAVLYFYTQRDFTLTLAIIFGTTAYHFIMRLAVGFVINLIMHNRADYHTGWFKVRKWELKLYKKLKVKKYKGGMPTYEPELFDPKLHSWSEIAGAMCQAEVVHEVIVILSFLPILAAIPFGALPVFIITSVLSACFDMMFVIMQRYNRSRIVKLADRCKKVQINNSTT